MRGTVLAGFHVAAEGLWGKRGLSDLGALLPAAVRTDTVEQSAVSLEWFPEQYVLDWYQAVWRGPAGESAPVFKEFLDRMMDAGFGRVRRALLGLASPGTILQRAEGLWRHDHSHGRLSATAVPGGAKLELSQHPYCDDRLGALAIAEIYRYCVELCRVKGATETHRRDPNGVLVVHLRWGP